MATGTSFKLYDTVTEDAVDAVIGLINSGDISTPGGASAQWVLADGSTTFNTSVGVTPAQSNPTGALLNTSIGFQSLQSNISGLGNNAIGVGALGLLTTGVNNNALGLTALGALVTGNNNIGIGLESGIFYTGAESNNILIGTAVFGTAGESNVIRIGNSSSGNSQQNTCYIAGISAATLPNPTKALVYVDTTNGQLGQSVGVVSLPPSSAIATTTFGTSMTAGSAVQNTSGYNVMLNIAVSVSSASGGTIILGVGDTSAPIMNTVIPAVTVGSDTIFTFTAIVPESYWCLIDTTGTITITGINVQVCAL